MRAGARPRPDGDAWIEGAGWDPDRWGRWPTADDLERAAPGRRVALWAHDHHALLASRAALAEAGVGTRSARSRRRRHPPRRDGAPTGVLHEAATRLVAVPDPAAGAWPSSRRRCGRSSRELARRSASSPSTTRAACRAATGPRRAVRGVRAPRRDGRAWPSASTPCIRAEQLDAARARGSAAAAARPGPAGPAAARLAEDASPTARSGRGRPRCSSRHRAGRRRAAGPERRRRRLADAAGRARELGGAGGVARDRDADPRRSATPRCGPRSTSSSRRSARRPFMPARRARPAGRTRPTRRASPPAGIAASVPAGPPPERRGAGAAAVGRPCRGRRLRAGRRSRRPARVIAVRHRRPGRAVRSVAGHRAAP